MAGFQTCVKVELELELHLRLKGCLTVLRQRLVGQASQATGPADFPGPPK